MGSRIVVGSWRQEARLREEHSFRDEVTWASARQRASAVSDGRGIGSSNVVQAVAWEEEKGGRKTGGIG